MTHNRICGTSNGFCVPQTGWWGTGGAQRADGEMCRVAAWAWRVMLSTNREIFKKINDDEAFAAIFKDYMFRRIYSQVVAGAG